MSSLKQAHFNTKRVKDNTAQILEHPEVAQLLTELDSCQVVNTTQHWLINVAWEFGLRNHPDRNAVRDILNWNQSGYPVTANEIDCAFEIEDYAVTPEEAIAGIKKLTKLVKCKRIFGPFKTRKEAIEFIGHDTFRLWPVFYKHELNKLRLLVNLSYDKNGPSFNDNISEHEKCVSYIRILDIVRRFTAAGVNYIWTMDAHMAYYSVPIPRNITPFVGIKVCDRIFFYATLTMGMASACKQYTKFAETIVWIIVNYYPLLFHHICTDSRGMRVLICLLLSYIDDYIGGANTYEGAKTQMYYTRWWWDILGVPTNDEKCKGPLSAITVLGYLFDMLHAWLRISFKRWKKYKFAFFQLLFLVKNNKLIDIRFALKVRGYLRSMQIVYPYTIPYLRSLETITNIPGQMVQGRWVYDQTHIDPLKEDTSIIADLDYLAIIYDDWEQNKISYRSLLTTQHNCDWEIWTDASTLIGVGGYVHRPNGKYFANFWEHFPMMQHWQYKPDILFLELLGVVLGLNLFTDDTTAGQRVLVRCDNKPAVKICAKKCACLRRPDLTALVQIYCNNAHTKNFRPFVIHVAGEDNPVADAFSRKKSINELLPFDLAKQPIETTKAINDMLSCWELNMNKVQVSAQNSCDCNDNWLCKKQRYKSTDWDTFCNEHILF